ncbi:TonB-dependent receptor [Sorangium sp. So ce321]|uniref:TonB-dependent receptor n=1 Tax=Sorangium sp. So ce321 TaxID=3133300 RepID=UPI003F6386A9
MRCVRMGCSILLALLVQLSRVASAEESATLVGVARDAATNEPLPGTRVEVVSTTTGVSRTVVTGTSGEYRVSGLSPDRYAIRVNRASFRPYAVLELDLHATSTNRVDVKLVPLELGGEEIVVEGRAPSIDVGSSTTGVTITPELLHRVPLWRQNAKGAAMRSFEALSEVAPGVNADLYGYSMSGASSPENLYLVDGITVREPGQGFVGTPLSAEFVREVNVLTSGLKPEYGGVTGGVSSVVTKTGTNELHGSLFSSITPGVLEGARRPVRREGQTIQTDITLSSIRDIGFDIGGPIREGRLWYYSGAALSLTRFDMDRYLNRQVWNGAGPNAEPVIDSETGGTAVTPIPGTNRLYHADQRGAQAIGKLTWQANENIRGEVVAFGSYLRAGGNGTFAVRPQTGDVEHSNIAGTFGSLASDVTASSINAATVLSASFMDRRLLLDVSFAGARYRTATLPSDGSSLGNDGGLASIPHVWDRKGGPESHSITEYGEATAETCPFIETVGADGSGLRVPMCPVSEYHRGGTRGIDISTFHHFHGKASVTWLAKALGQHVVKVGLDADVSTFDHELAYPGGVWFRENSEGTRYTGTRYGYLVGPDQPKILPSLQTSSASVDVGGFVQDGWSVAQGLVVNLGVRYDSQVLVGDEGRVAIALHHEWAPRVGLVYDLTRAGRSRVFGSFARYFESIPLSLADRSFPGDRIVRASYHKDPEHPDACVPLGPEPAKAVCDKATPGNRQWNPNRAWTVLGGEPAQIDPSLRPQSLDEIVLGAECELIPGGRIALHYTKRYMNDVVEDVSRDNGSTSFIGNPGAGIARDVPAAVRNYDAVTLLAAKSFSRGWLAQASYTLSWLRGNYAGLFQPETTQLQPNRNSDFDSPLLWINRTGDLPGDRRHQIKVFGAKDFAVASWAHITVGLAVRAQSGGPTNYLAGYPGYGSTEVFILPRGSGERLPWVASVDPRLVSSFALGEGMALSFSVDAFNVFNFHAVTAVDNRYTSASITPIENGTSADMPAGEPLECNRPACKLVYAESDTPFDPKDKNPNFGKPTAYQAPLQVRIAANLTF